MSTETCDRGVCGNPAVWQMQCGTEYLSDRYVACSTHLAEILDEGLDDGLAASIERLL